MQNKVFKKLLDQLYGWKDIRQVFGIIKNKKLTKYDRLLVFLFIY